MNSFKKNQISRQKEKEYTFFEQIHDLDFDYTRQEDDVLINSKPFYYGGIDYYVKRKKLILDKWGSTSKKMMIFNSFV